VRFAGATAGALEEDGHNDKGGAVVRTCGSVMLSHATARCRKVEGESGRPHDATRRERCM
jgi:hypothetical protein